MMIDLDNYIYDENKIEELKLNCTWTVPSGASHDSLLILPEECPPGLKVPMCSGLNIPKGFFPV